jgi:serine/threonine protein kinase
MSPQILNHQKYTNKSDLWSVGLIYYELLHGFTPWPASNELQLINGINNKKISFDPSISQNSKDFIRRCLMRKEEERMSWEEAFNHPLVTEGMSPSPRLRKEESDKEKENITPRQRVMEAREKEARSKSRSVSANMRISNLNRTPKRLRNMDVTPDKKSPMPWKH